ncbi:MAG: DUF6298 domain-containing protein [Phycisphaerae bacterium]|nr:DUF6298 domain-containing protein [Phycisphaerae bacterium]
MTKDRMLQPLVSGIFWLAAVFLIALPTVGQTTRIQDSEELRQLGPDERGNRLPDFSYCGYAMQERPIPDVPVRIVVPVRAGDNTRRIQAAIDYVSQLPPDDRGIRGAVLLQRGKHEIAGGLHIRASGVVLRGCGSETLLVGTGNDRRTLIRITGAPQTAATNVNPVQIRTYVPVGADAVGLEHPAGAGLAVGDLVAIRRRSAPEWIRLLGMDDLGGDRHGPAWKPGTRDLVWHRSIRDVRDDRIVLDAPLTMAIDPAFGGGSIVKISWTGRIENVGVENLSLVSIESPSHEKDEDHAWFGITIENARDVWVRQVTFRHFVGGAVAAWETASRVTVEHCASLRPISEIGGWRRIAFFTAGELTLFKHCYSELGRHDFAVGHAAAGPNAFVQCEANGALAHSGPIDSAAAGVLFDLVRIDGNALSLMNRHSAAQGAGWTAFNCVLWNCSAAWIHNFAPPGATNWAFGTWGEFAGDGRWFGSNGYVQPLSLFQHQVRRRLGDAAARQIDLMEIETDATSSPTPDQAAELTAASRSPASNVLDWIASAPRRHPVPIDDADAPSIDEVWSPEAVPARPKRPLSIVRGVLSVDGQPLAGSRMDTPWWQGGIRPHDITSARPAVTRFVPGRYGQGTTDHLPDVLAFMLQNNVAALDHHYGLWYDRRRDDHQRVRRMDGDVAPPFYEQPFARSGVGTAADGLSQYDLTKFNPWYFDRLKEFAGLCDEHGRVLLLQHYFQHNILEAGAHYTDFPWRTANNINETGFPEPPFFAGDKRVFLAEQFYDITHPVRRELHRAYIRKCLDTFSENTNVIHFTSEEFTGPLHFVQFWLDTIAQWQRETGHDPLVGLAATKDVQDAILADPERATVVDVIDIRYWYYQSDGALYAPPGGAHLAPRQWARLLKPRPPSREQAIRAVTEYRQRYPHKAVTYSVEGQNFMDFAAAVD